MAMEIYPGNTSLYGKRIAAIDIGSHTTRMLIAEYTDSPRLFRALGRKREYTRLAEGFKGNENGDLAEDAVARTADAIRRFAAYAKRRGVENLIALSTGIARRADNRKYFLDSVKEKSGIDIKIISGEREALLTMKGVIHGSGTAGAGSQVVFDLGGATTEFIWVQGKDLLIRSLPIGAFVLTQGYLHSDPPEADMIRGVSAAVDSILDHSISAERDGLNNVTLTGSGGTATTLAAINNRLSVRDIIPERINGMVVSRGSIEALFNRLKTMPLSCRKRIRGMEQGRAGVIVAGTLAVLRIMHFFNSAQMTVSYSDILEGIIISHIMEEDNE